MADSTRPPSSAWLKAAKGLGERAQAGAEDRKALPGLESGPPDRDRAFGGRRDRRGNLGVGAAGESDPRGNARGDGRGGAAGAQRMPAGDQPDEHDRQAGGRHAHGRARHHDSDADDAESQRPGDERRESDRETLAAIGRVAAAVGVRQHLGPEGAEGHGQDDQQEVAELGGRLEGSPEGSALAGEDRGDDRLEAAREDGRRRECPAPRTRSQKLRRGREQDGTTAQQQDNCGRLLGCERDARQGGRLAVKAKQLSGFVVNLTVHGSNLRERRFGQWDQLQETEQRHGQDRRQRQEERTKRSKRRPGGESQSPDCEADGRDQQPADRRRSPGDRGGQTGNPGATEPRG